MPRTKITIIFSIIIFAVLILPKISQAAIPSTLGWYEIPNTQIADVCAATHGFPQVLGQTGCSAIVSAWNSAIFDSVRNRMIIWGGGHADYYGNELYSLDINSLSMQKITDPGLPIAFDQESLVNGTQPNSRHTYDQIEYLANLDKMWVYGGALAGNGNGSGAVWMLNLDTLTWTRKNPTGAAPDSSYELATAYNPNNGKVLVKDVWALRYYDPVVDTWSDISTDAHSGYHQVGVFDAVNNKFLIIGDPYGNNGLYYYDIDSSHCVDSAHQDSCIMRTLNTTGGNAIVGATDPGLAWDSDRQQIVAWAGGNTVYYLTPNYSNGTGVWTPVTYSGGPGAQSQWGTYGRFQYSPTSKVFVLVNSVDQNAYTFRLTSGTPPPTDTTPPTVSISSPTSGSTVSGSSATVSATASDNVGVTGVQFKLDGVNLGSEDTASPYSISWNTTQTTNGSHALSAIARDAAGNQTTSSGITVTVNNAVADTQAPTIPTNLSASAISSSQINLSWTASTDAVGVTGYRIYRCQGTGCTPSTQISTSATNSYSDSGLSPSTTYVYRVAAYDAVPNVSGQSSSAGATTQAVSVLALSHDGPVTPEQISIFIPSSLPTTATAAVRYRKVGNSTWTTGHPLHRIRPSFADSGMTVQDGFAWPIIGLSPGTSYEVEVTITNGAQNTIYSGIMTTRALPAAAGAPTKTIASGSTSAQIQAVFDNAVAGDVIQFANGTYNVSNLTLNRKGTISQPIYIRGQSRAGVVLRDSNRVFHLLDASDIVIENLTLQGSGIDSGIAASSRGIAFYDGYIQERVTIRNITITGVDMGVIVYGEAKQVLVYDNTMTGNNQWNQDLYAYSGSGAPGAGNGTPDVDENLFWNDDGIRITGLGNAAFNNTLSGFGDALAMADYYESNGVHFYRNDIQMTGDDAIEGDYGKRNITFYDNRIHNAMTFVSLDPIWGGPFVAARNIAINIGRGPLKLNSTNTGHFFYNNTIVSPENKNVWGWVQYNNGDQRAWGYQNNILIYRGSGNLMAFEPGAVSPLDFTHNSWYPNRSIWWSNSGGSFTSLLATYSGLSATTPVFSGITKRHEQDNISESDPFITDINFGIDYHTKVSTLYAPNLSSGTAPKNSGVAITNITDGFSGNAPDRGAIISGILTPTWGDRGGNPPSSDTTPPSAPTGVNIQ